MSITEQSTEPDHETAEAERDPAACVHCGTPMAADQEWCLECGAARTLIHRPPDWRVPVAVIGTIVVLAAAALAVALINLSSSAARSVTAPTVVARSPGTSGPPTTRARTTVARTKRSSTGAGATPSTTPTTATTATTAANPPGIASWPVALSEWTVVLARYSDQVTANATALRVKTEGLPAGVLNSNAHASLRPGGWLVFTGRYPSRAQALAAAQQLRAHGHTARARLVAPTASQ